MLSYGLIRFIILPYLFFKGQFSGKPYFYHFINNVLLLGTVLCSWFYTSYRFSHDKAFEFDPWLKYGWFTPFLFTCCCLPLLGLPQAIVNFLGLISFQSFPKPPQFKVTRFHSILFPSNSMQYSFWSIQYDSHTTSRICFRVVTRGDYPELVRNNCYRNINTCQDVGLRNFYVEVVTDKSISIAENESVREVVVPSNYTTRSGAMFKARALQYALEDEVNICLC